MSEVCKWVVNAALYNWRPRAESTMASPSLLRLPQDVFLGLCEWLSMKDILALRMTNKSLAGRTRSPSIWLSMLRRLIVPLPILPATSKYRFGEIHPKTYEWLMRRALYLEQNWRRRHPIASHSHFQAHGCTIVMRLLPGGKYLVTVAHNLEVGRYWLIVWDLDHGGCRVPLASASSRMPFLKLDVKFGVVKGAMCIVIAYAKSPVKKNNKDHTQVFVLCLPLQMLEEVAECSADPDIFDDDETFDMPFRIIHESWTSCDVGQLVLGHTRDELVLAVVHRPRALIFHYLESCQRGTLLLGRIFPFDMLRTCVWAIKLLPGQNSVLVSRIVIENGVEDSTLLCFDIFLLPGPGSAYKNPTTVGRQLIQNAHVDGFYFSDRDESWFHNLNDPRGLLPSPYNRQPPPISIFVTTREPRGFVHCVLTAVPSPHEVIKLPNGRGEIPHYVYQMPVRKIARHTWRDTYARPIILPGAYRSIILMRPHLRPELQTEGVPTGVGMEVLRMGICTTKCDEYENFATPTTIENVSQDDNGEPGDDAHIDVPEGQTVVNEEDLPMHKRLMRFPDIPQRLVWKMKSGTTAFAWDESIGRFCFATTEDASIDVLDFGTNNFDVVTVPRL